MPSTWPEKAKLTMDFLAFPSVKLCKIWQSGSKYFILVRTRFFREAYKTSVFAVVKGRHKFEKKIQKTAFTTAAFFVFKIFIPLKAMCCKNFGRVHRRKFKKIPIKAIKTVKTHLFEHL